MMSMHREQLHAKRMDGSEKRAAKRFHGFQRQAGFENSLARSLLHFIGSAIRVSHDDKLRQPFKRALPIFRDLNDPTSDRARFSRASGSDDGEVAIQFFNESLPRGIGGTRGQCACSPSSMPYDRAVGRHF